MPDEMSLDEFTAYAGGIGDEPSGKEPARFVPPSVQASRDTASLEDLHAERKAAKDPADQAALGREIHNRRQSSSQKTMSIDDFEKAAKGPDEPPPAHVTVEIDKPKPALLDTVKSYAVGALKEVASVGDLIIGVPGGAASSIGELGMQADMARQGISRASGEAAAKEFGAFIAEQSQPRILSTMVAHLAKEAGTSPDPSMVEQALGKLNEYIDKGAEFIDTKTGGKLSKAEVVSEANLLMNLLGARGLGKLGPKLGDLGEKPLSKPKVEGTEGLDEEAGPQAKKLDPTDGQPTPEAFSALESKLKPVKNPHVMSEKEVGKVAKAWGSFVAGRTDTEAQRLAAVKEAPKETAVPPPEEPAANTPPGEEKVVPINRTSAEAKLAAKGYKVDVDYEDEGGYIEHQDGTRYYWEDKANRFEDEDGNPLPKDAEEIAQYIGNVKDGLEDPEEITGVANDRMFNQRGGASTDMMKTIAGASVGLVVANQLDPENPLVAGVIGALAGVTAAHGLGGVKSAFSAFTKADSRIRINDITEEHQVGIDRMQREVAKTSFSITELVPKKADREAIHRAIDEGKVGELKGDQAKAAGIAQKFYADIAEQAQKLGVLDSARENYSTHIWNDPVAARGLLEQKQSGMSSSTKFNKERTHLTIADGEAAGLKLKTTDIAEVMATYGNSMGRTMATAKLVQRLKQSVGPDGKALVAKVGKAPKEFVQVDSPAIRALRVHPDIAPSLKFVLEAEQPGTILSALSALNTALKRNQVSFSMFHAKSLLEAGIVAGHPFKSFKVALQSAAPKIFGTNKYLEMLRKGGLGDEVDKMVRDGLKLSFERGEPADLDVGGGFYHGMKVLQTGMDKVLPGGIGKTAVGAYVKLNHVVDNFMWAKLHASLKAEVYMAKREGLMQNTAKAGKPLTEEQAGRLAATYTNDVFGGLNWQRLAESTRTKFGRDAALALNSRTGRMVQGLMEFAPDWTLSTLRAFYKAMPQSLSLKKLPGAIRGAIPDELGGRALSETDLYRQQLVRFGIYYVTGLNAINMAMSGHPIWENKDKTRIDLGDGRTMQAAKHSFEAFHLMQDPAKFALNKLGTVPKEAATQALGVEYLNPRHMPPMKNRAEHLAKNFLPISAGQFSQGIGPGLAGFGGAPIYGKTADEKREMRKLAREDRHQKMLKQYKKSHGIDQ